MTTLPHIKKLQGELRAARCEISKLHRQVNTLAKTVQSELLQVKHQALAISGKEEAAQNMNSSFPDRCEVAMRPIGRIESPFILKNGTPRQPGLAPSAVARLRVQWGTNPSHSLEGIEAFSHVWLLWVFDLNGGESVKAKVKPPRLEGEQTGVFACRTPHRPNPIGTPPHLLSSTSFTCTLEFCVHRLHVPARPSPQVQGLPAAISTKRMSVFDRRFIAGSFEGGAWRHAAAEWLRPRRRNAG